MAFLIAYITTYSIFIPLIIGLILFRYLNKPQKILLYLIIFGSSVELVSLTTNMQNLWVYNIFDIVEFTLLMLMFKLIIFESQLKNIFIPLIITNILIRVLLVFLDVDSIYNIKSYFTLITNAIIIILSMRELLAISLKGQKLLLQNPLFWILISLLIYFATTIFVNFISFLVEAEKLYSIYIIHSIANLLANMFFTYAFYQQYKNLKLNPSI